MNRRILIVEDQEEVRRLLREWLSLVLRGWDFLEAASGEEAVSLAHSSPLELVLMDIALPRMSGLEATRQIKAVLPATPVVMLTVHEEEAYRAEAEAAGASAYVPKQEVEIRLVPVINDLLTGRHHAQREIGGPEGDRSSQAGRGAMGGPGCVEQSRPAHDIRSANEPETGHGRGPERDLDERGTLQ